jgi:hypothetical protein
MTAVLTRSEAGFIDGLVGAFKFSVNSYISAATAKFRPDLQPIVTVADRFNRAVRKHQMTIKQDNGLHRHLTFKEPGTNNNCFHITTWPGYLAISGDAGSYVFARLPDMFEFFRGDHINQQYWGEKLQAVDRHGGYREFSEECFHEAIKYDFDNWTFDCDEDDEPAERAKAWEALQESDLAEDASPESIEDAIQRASVYECPVSGNGFQDFWDRSLEDYTFRFSWCCHAIQWAVSVYDAAKTADLSQSLSATEGKS